VDIKGARFPSQKKSGLRSSHSDVPWCPSLVCRLESLRGHGCRCHEPSDVRPALPHSNEPCVVNVCSLTANEPCVVNVCSLTANEPCVVSVCSLTANEPCVVNVCSAGDCCDNKASSDAQAPLRGARDQYSKILRVFEEAKTCATSSSCSYSEGSDDP
jgi:hypothetical protein